MRVSVAECPGVNVFTPLGLLECGQESPPPEMAKGRAGPGRGGVEAGGGRERPGTGRPRCSAAAAVPRTRFIILTVL